MTFLEILFPSVSIVLFLIFEATRTVETEGRSMDKLRKSVLYSLNLFPLKSTLVCHYG